MSRTRSLAIRFGGLVAISAFTMFLASCAPQAQVATFKSLPARADLPSTVNESLIIELYSK